MKYIIVGGVAGGAGTAARVRRLDEQAEILLVEKGAHISYANCGLPYYIGEVIQDRNKLFVQSAATFKNRFEVEVRTLSEVVSIDRQGKSLEIKDMNSGRVYRESYDKLVLSPGASPVRPPLSGIGEKGIFTLRNVQDTDAIKDYVKQFPGGRVVIVGGGFIGLEMAENLHGLGMQITVVEMGDQILAPADFPLAAMAQQHLRDKGIDLRLRAAVAGFSKGTMGLDVHLADGTSLQAEVVLLSIGVKPEGRLARECGLPTGKTGGILVNEYLQTADPDIYAVGDVIEFENPLTGQIMPTYLAGPANKQARICANNMVLGNRQTYKGSVNTAIVQLFDLTLAVTGVTSKQLTAAGIDHRVSTTHSGSHAGYYPGGSQLSIQICFAPGSGRLLGAQVIGKSGVDKRIDVLSSLIQRQGTIYDLMEFEHAYAPPYSSAKDPLNMAGFVADNILSGKLFVVPWSKTRELGASDFLVDVREGSEYAAGHIPGAVNIPMEELRNRLEDIPADKTIYIYCQIGLRGYLAQRILLQRGFGRVFNISGGFLLWNICMRESGWIEKKASAMA